MEDVAVLPHLARLTTVLRLSSAVLVQCKASLHRSWQPTELQSRDGQPSQSYHSSLVQLPEPLTAIEH